MFTAFFIVFYLLPDSWFFVRVFCRQIFVFEFCQSLLLSKSVVAKKKQTESKRTMLLNLIQTNVLYFSNKFYFIFCKRKGRFLTICRYLLLLFHSFIEKE